MSTAASSSLFSYEVFVHAVAGTCGSMCAMAVTIPLDTARTRLLHGNEDSRGNGNGGRQKDEGQAFTAASKMIVKIIQEEGIVSLYRGAKSTLQSVAVSNFVYFYTFHGLKQMVAGYSRGAQSAVTDLALATVAGTINVLLTNPLWVVNSRLKMVGTSETAHKYKGLVDGLLRMWSEEGLSSLWSGTVPSLVLVSNPAIKFTIYEWLKRRMLSDGGSFLTPTEAFFTGVLASAIATLFTYPMQVIQAKARHGNIKGLPRNASMAQLTVFLIRNFGVAYLFRGLDAKLMQTVIAAGFMFLTYEEMAALIFKLFGLKAKKSA